MSDLIPYQFELNEELRGTPDEFTRVRLTLPDGRRARFMRFTDWEVPTKENVPELFELNQEDSR